jgi:predicted flap endonuclease-1-like 5' DNA nuclease
MTRDSSLTPRGPAKEPHPRPNQDSTTQSESETHPIETLDWPSTIAGWTRINTDPYIVTYWKASSNHVQGTHTRVAVFSQNTRDTIKLSRTSFNQFGGKLSKTTIGTISMSSPRLVRSAVQTTLERSPGDGTLSDIPRLPSTCGQWELQTGATSAHVGTTRWEHATADAALSVVQAAHPHAHSSRRPSTLRYEGTLPETEANSETILTAVPRTSALEAAVHTLKTLPAPVASCQDTRATLRRIRGVGAAKSRHLLLAGITSPADIRAVLTGEFSINHHWTTAVTSLLTPTIKRAVQTE